MKVLNIKQGSDEWLSIRRLYDTASEASMMMGCHPNVSREELIKMKAIGTEQEFSDFVQKFILDKGHEVEALARPIAEKIICEDLYPVTGVDGCDLLASFDGCTLMEDIIWECKQWNEEKAKSVSEGQIPDCDRWQVVQQLVISGAEKCLYMVTNGTEEKTVYMWVALQMSEADLLRHGWEQLRQDVKKYQPEVVTPEPEGNAPDSLPALNIEVTGMVTASNLAEFKAHSLAVIGAISTNLDTDGDFASAEKTVKWCKDVEQRLSAAKDHALSQTSSIDELLRTIDDIAETTRTKRLELDKLVKARKKHIKDTILHNAITEARDYIRAAENEVKDCNISLPGLSVSRFNDAIKGKKLLDVMRSALSDEVALVKVEATTLVADIKKNMAVFNELTKGKKFLFDDLKYLVHKPEDDFKACIELRISKHEQEEAKRIESERHRIQKEEEAKAQREAKAEAEADRERIRKEERAKAQAEEQATHKPEKEEESKIPQTTDDTELPPPPNDTAKNLICPCCNAELRITYSGLKEVE